MSSRHRPPGSSRRDFLTRASAATAGALILPGLGRRRQSPNAAVGLGIMGTGGMGSAHCDALMKLSKAGAANVRIVALADVCKPRLDACVERCSKGQETAVPGHRRYEDLLARKDVDAVLIAAPEHWHAQMAIDALEAGKDVYVEKPMTLDLKDALRLWAAVKKHPDRIAEVGTQYVLEPKYRKARELIEAGKIGKPVTSETGYFRNSKIGEWNYYQVDPKVEPGEMLDWERWCGPLGAQNWDTLIYHRWRRYRKYSTGIVGDLLVHQMTPLMQALDQGWPVRVVATGGHYIDEKMENFDQVNILVQFEKGHTMTVSGSTCNASGPAPMIRGYKGNLHLSGNKCRLTPENIWAEEIDGEDNDCPTTDPHDLIRQDFISCVQERRPAASPVELGVKVMVIVDLAARSMWEGRAFTFDPKTLTAAGV